MIKKYTSLKNTKGITLVALVITIVILLILAGISINLTLGQNGIITRTAEAKKKNEEAKANEKVELMMDDYAVEKSTGTKTLEEFLTEKENNGEIEDFTDNEDTSYTVKVDGYEIIVNKQPRSGLKVGDYIDYTPDKANSYEFTTYTGSNNNSASVTQDSLKWQILKINDDGSMDLIGSVTSQGIYFQGATGYNNGINVMNDICKSLYSKNSQGITARSVNIDDIEYWLTPDAKNIRDTYCPNPGRPIYGHTQTYCNNNLYFPSLYAKELGAKIDSGLEELTDGEDMEPGNAVGLKPSEEGNATGMSAASKSLTVTETFYEFPSTDNTIFGDGTKTIFDGTTYWLASRYAICATEYAAFGLRCVNEGLLDGFFLFSSDYDSREVEFRLRPVVTISADAKVTASDTASDSNGTPHTITQY